MTHGIRYAMHHGTINKMTGTVEADETFIGGKARFHAQGPNEHERSTATGAMGKAIVFGSAETRDREGSRRCRRDAQGHHLQAEIRSNVAEGVALYTDALHSYDGLDPDYAHKVSTVRRPTLTEQCIPTSSKISEVC